jgi:cell division protein FtsA
MELSVILEIGTSYTRGIVIQPNENGSYKIIAMAEAVNTGVKKSEIVNKDNTITSIKTALKSLSLMCGGDIQIRSVNLIYSGGNIDCEQISGMQTLQSNNAVIEHSDIHNALQNAKTTHLQEDRFIVEDILLDYMLNGTQRVDNPIGMTAQSIHTNLIRLHVDKNRIENILNTLEDCSLDYEKVYISGLCSALGATTPQQREEGVLVINFGGGSTTWAAYVGKNPRAVGGIPIGGDHITNDIHCAFKTTAKISETLKRQHGSATIISKHQLLEYQQDFTSKVIDQCDLSRVINARMDETLRIIHEYISRDNLIEAITSIVICGKGALLNNLTTLTSNIFERPCKIANPPLPANLIKPGANTTAYVPLIGAAECCTKEAILEERKKKSDNKIKKIFQKIFG